MENLIPLLEAAKQAGIAAGELLKTKRETLAVAHQTMPHDMKTEADQAAEKLIRASLEPLGLPVVGEEYGGDESLLKSDKYYWAVDPLDGTVNYMHNLPFSGVSIGLMQGTEPILGVINLFGLGEMYAGGKGLGVALNGRRIEPKYIANTQEELLAVSCATIRSGEATALSGSYIGIRDFGAATVDMAFVISGRAGAYHAKYSYIWDFAAAYAMLLELGYFAKATHLEGFKFCLEVARKKAGS